MSFLSLRLGYTLPLEPGAADPHLAQPVRKPLLPAGAELGAELLGVPSNGDAFVELSDGGHFENLGLYELVRRRCGLIIVCDGGAGPAAPPTRPSSPPSPSSREDFGTDFAFDFGVRGAKGLEPSGPQQVVARQRRRRVSARRRVRPPRLLPRQRPLPRAGAATRVPMAQDGPELGLIIYLKSAMIPSLSLSSRGYKGAFPEFPYELTADQFFSPEQFEAYRDVGERIAEQMIRETDLRRVFAGGRPPLSRLRRNYAFAAPRC